MADDDHDHPPGDIDEAALPNFLAVESDLELLRAELHSEADDHAQIPLRERTPQPYIELPAIRSTPLNEFNRSQALLSLAFPTLYPNGQADFIAPRQRSIRYDEYIEHALKHHDGRFAHHPRFRYVCFNTLMRQQVSSCSTFFVKKPGHNRLIDIADIRRAFDDDDAESKALLNSIVCHSGSLRGTRAYWGGRRYQPEAYVHGLGCPGVFLTFSAADLYGESLQKHLPRYNEWLQADHRAKLAIAGYNLKDNPHIAAFHFHHRFKAFLDYVVKPKFGVTDFWFRYEWQARGSTHAYGPFWIKDSPAAALEIEAARAEFA